MRKGAWSRVSTCRTCAAAILLALTGLSGLIAAPTAAAAFSAQLRRHSTLGAGVAAAPSGVKLTSIVPGSPADGAGLRVGDIITLVGGKPVTSVADFVQLIKSGRAGRPIAFTIQRDASAIVMPVTLAAAPDEKDPTVATSYEALPVDGTLRRTLVTVPAAAARGKHPAMLLVGGIGCYTIDNALDTDNAYMRLSHDISRAGFLVMRIEKSGVGDSQGPPCATVDLLTEMHSYEVALDALRHDPRVDAAHVYILGHSIGTLIAPRLASMTPVSGLIVAEGVGRNWIEYELPNLRRQLELDRKPAVEVEETMRLKEDCMHRLLVDRQAEVDIEKTEPGCKDINVYPAPASYMQQAAALNIAEPWTQLSVPVLVLYGTADFVTAKDDHQRIADVVNAAHPGNATFAIIDGMDHLLQVGGTQQQDFDRGKKGGSGKYDEQLSAAVTAWLCAREHCLKG
jgi:uncharacterized protein